MSFTVGRTTPLPQRGFIIKHKNQVLGFPHQTRHYVVGFRNVMLARLTQYKINPQPSFRLERSQVIDISNAVDLSLENIAKEYPTIGPLFGQTQEEKGQITIDVGSKLFASKMVHPGGVWDPLNDGGFFLEQVPVENLYMLPFNTNVGVVLPRELIEETDRELVFDCEVIDPVESTWHFRKSLKL